MENQYTIKKYTSQNFSDIKDFFNKHSKYQIGNEKLEIEDIELSFKAKEIDSMYLLYYNNVLVGTSATFHFIYQGYYFENSIYTGFLLIDSNHRMGSAIKKLNNMAYKYDNGENSHLTEINIENKRSLKLSKLNGYVKFEMSLEDISHHILLINKLPLISNVFQSSSEMKEIYDINSLKFQKAEWEDELGYKAHLEMSNKKLEFIIKNVKPWYIDIDLIKLKLISNNKETIVSITQKSIDFNYIDIFNSKEELIFQQNIDQENNIIKIPNSSNNILKFTIYHKTRGKLNLTAEPYIQKYNLVNNNIYYLKEHCFFDYFILDTRNGDVYIYKNGNSILNEKHIRVKFHGKIKIELIKHNDNKFEIILKDMSSTVRKFITFNTNGYNIYYDFSKDNHFNLIKCGISIMNENYYIYNGNDFEIFNLGISPPENIDFLKKKYFSTKDKSFLLEGGQYYMNIKSEMKSSNQLLYRPLFLVDNSGQYLEYTATFKKLEKNIKFSSNYKLIPIHLKNIRAYTCNKYNNLNENIYKNSKIKYYINDYYQIEKNIKFSNANQNKLIVYFDLHTNGKILLYEDNKYQKLNNMDFWRQRFEEVMFYSENKHSYFHLSMENQYFHFFKNGKYITFKVVLETNEKMSSSLKIKSYGGILYE